MECIKLTSRKRNFVQPIKKMAISQNLKQSSEIALETEQFLETNILFIATL